MSCQLPLRPMALHPRQSRRMLANHLRKNEENVVTSLLRRVRNRHVSTLSYFDCFDFPIWLLSFVFVFTIRV